jgi:carbonic anhydrase/acetyltransferase-like protein (isoleucine patch superfamily)
MVLGSPGKVVRKLSPEEILRIHETSEHYVANFKRYRANLKAEP